MWRQWIYTRMIGDPTLLALLPAGTKAIIGSGSLLGPPAFRPFIMVRFIDNIVRMRDNGKVRAEHEVVQFWVYDEPGSYVRIDTILERIQELFSGSVGVGHRLHMDWNGKGPELFDDEFKALVRWGSTNLVGAKEVA